MNKQKVLLTEEELSKFGANNLSKVELLTKGILTLNIDAILEAQIDKVWNMWEQEIIYWRGWLQQVMSEYLAEGISEKTKERVLEALREKNDGN